MDWGKILTASLTGALVGGTFEILIFLHNKFIDQKYKKNDNNIGTLDDIALSKLHRDIEKIITTNFDRICAKIDNIMQISIRNEERFKNLNLEQRDIRENIIKLITIGERLLRDNDELKL